MGSRLALWTGFLLVTACKPDQKISVSREPPAVTIIEPSAGTSVPQGVELQFKALVQTFDGSDFSELTHQWVTGTTQMCEPQIVPSTGEATCFHRFDTVGAQTVTVTVQDAQLDIVTATVDVEVTFNNPPTITVVAPTASDLLDPQLPIVLEASVSDVEDVADRMLVEVSSSIDGALGLPPAPTSDGTWTQSTYLSQGLHILTFLVTDTAGQTAQASVSVGVNGRPSAPVVAIDPDPAVSGEGLAVVLLTPSTDPDGDQLSYAYEWVRNGTVFSSGSNPTVPSGVTVRDDFWEVIVTPQDSFGLGATGAAASLIRNSPPSLQLAAISPTTPTRDDALTASASGWFDQDGDPELYEYRWYVNGVLDAVEVTAVYPSSKTQRDDEIRVEILPKDAYDYGLPVSSVTVTVQNALPSQPTVNITPDLPGTNQDLQCQIIGASTDPDGDAVTYEYTWYQNGVVTSNTSSLVSSDDTSVGDTWECRVTPSDGTVSGPSGSDVVSVQDIVAPEIPEIDDIGEFLNEPDVTLTGVCEPDCLLTFYCSDALTTWTVSDQCDGGGEFETAVTLTDGELSECYAECEDTSGNISDASNTVSATVCSAKDLYEDDLGYGDLPQAAIDQWATIPDDGTTSVLIEGNILDRLDEDWYVIQTSDDVAADRVAGIDRYNFEVEVTKGSSVYSVLVYRGGYSGADLECPANATAGYTEYNDFGSDLGEVGTGPGDLGHPAPSDEQACGLPGDPLLNECTDFGTEYYIRVLRDSVQALSCESYQLTITNGGPVP